MQFSSIAETLPASRKGGTTAPYKLNYPTLIFWIVAYPVAALGVYYMFSHGLSWPEIILAAASYFLGFLGITALYHRAWSHNAVVFKKPLEYALAVCSILVIQCPGIEWVNDHIQHHQHTDHDGDPYNINKGFWWAHHNWFIFSAPVNIRLPERLQNNPVVHWQKRWYWTLSILLNLVLPAVVAMAAGAPWWGGVATSFLRVSVCNHFIWCVNSVCHTFGRRPFTKNVSARNVWWMPFMLGEQYHNYHHAFPRDYRNGIAWYDFDPTKWFIWAAHKLSLAQAPFKMPDERIAAARAASK